MSNQKNNDNSLLTRSIDDLFFSNNNSTPTYDVAQKPNTEQSMNNNTTEYNLFGYDIPKKIPNELPRINNFEQLAKLAENPNIFGHVVEYDLTDRTISKPTQQQQSFVPIAQPPQIQPKRREISLFYFHEIAQFTNSEVNEAMQSKIDSATGEVYGPISEFKVGAALTSSSEFAQKLHRDYNLEISHPKNCGAASSLLILKDCHDDRGNIILFNGDNLSINGQMNEPPLVGDNLSLARNSQFKIPVRVIRRIENGTYRYDGLYFVGDYWFERTSGDTTLWHYMFKLVRIFGQTPLPHNEVMKNPPKLVPPQPLPPPMYSGDSGGMRQQVHQQQYPQQHYTQYHQQQYYQNSYSSVQAPSMPARPMRAPPVQRSSTGLGMDLNHGNVLELLSQLRRRNSSFNNRISQYEHNIETISGKELEGSAGSEDTLTSRNKGFYWKLDNEHPDGAKKLLKRKSDDIANDGGDEGESAVQNTKNKKPSKKRLKHTNDTVDSTTQQ
jgi:hypothetical protein